MFGIKQKRALLLQDSFFTMQTLMCYQSKWFVFLRSNSFNLFFFTIDDYDRVNEVAGILKKPEVTSQMILRVVADINKSFSIFYN